MVLFFCFNRIGLMLGRFPRETTRGHCLRPSGTTLPIQTDVSCSSHASVVQPPTSLWSEGACPVCTSLDQWHMGQTCVVFWGWREREKAWTASRSSRWRQWAGGCAGEPLSGGPALLAVSDLETFFVRGPKPRLFDATLRVCEDHRYWPIWAVGPADRDGLPVGPGLASLGPASRFLFLLPYKFVTPTIECRILSECRKDCVGGCGLGLTCPSESFYSPPFWPVSRHFARRVFSHSCHLAGVGYTNVGACGEPGRHRY